YLPASGTLNFAAGELTKQIFLNLPAGPATPGAAKTFNLTLSNPTGGATLGATTTAVVTIPAVATPPLSERGKFFAAGAGVGGGPRVRVVTLANAQASNNTGTTATATNDFFAYEESFRGGVTVAAGELTGDNLADIVAGSGVGGGPRVRVFDAKVFSA